MKATLIRYKTRPEATDENERLIRAVFDELRSTAPEGVRYMALRLADGSFVHIVANERAGANPIPELAAFRDFQSSLRERCIEPPQPIDATIIGRYRMPAD